MPSRQVGEAIRRHGADHLFAHVSGVLRQADVTIANLEAPLIERCRPIAEGFTFCGTPAFAAAMANAGIDVVALENNHIENFGRSGIKETTQHLENAGIDFATASHLAVRDIRGLTIGILAFSGVGHRFDRRQIVQCLERSRPLVDLLLVAFHWGKEYVSIPQACPANAPDDPRVIARVAIDHGADLILGNHPHWVQGVEFHRGKLITYSHGNLMFDQFWSVETRQGVIGKYTFHDRTLINVEFQPIFIDDDAQPQLISDHEGASIIRRMEGSSLILSMDT
jgi:poly-gamma-glutamate synthesis protein (capsule biosynthesis protein)